MTTPPYGPYGQPGQDPWGRGGGYGQYGGQTPPQQPQYGGQYETGNEQTQRFGGVQDPYGGQYGGTQQWPGAGYGGAQPPPEPPKKRTGLVVAIIVVAVLVLGGAGAGVYLLNKDDGGGTANPTTTSAPDETDTTTTTADGTTEDTTEGTTTEETAEPGLAIDAQPGDCIKVNVASATDADVETVDCATPEAIYKVATREDDDSGSCPNDQYVSYSEENSLLLCLQLNVEEGQCLQVTDIDDKRADCATPEATHKVVGVLDGVDDETQCADTATEVITYPKPPLTICLGEPAG
jgi:hypothetical protein